MNLEEFFFILRITYRNMLSRLFYSWRKLIDNRITGIDQFFAVWRW